MSLEAETIATEIYDESIANIEASAFSADSMLELYDDARRVVAAAGLEIGIAAEGEFLIGDAPAQTHPRGPGGIGPLRGTPWRGAGTISMPIGRRHVLALGRRDAYVSLDRAHVDELNRRQILTAHRFIAWHPDAALRAFVVAALPAREPSAP
jgi:hypothetical protein